MNNIIKLLFEFTNNKQKCFNKDFGEDYGEEKIGFPHSLRIIVHIIWKCYNMKLHQVLLKVMLIKHIIHIISKLSKELSALFYKI